MLLILCLIIACLIFIADYGALPMYFDMMGPHFVIAVRSCLGNDWYEALEYHWLALFDLMVYCMKFGWNLRRADEQKRARQFTKKRNEAENPSRKDKSGPDQQQPSTSHGRATTSKR